jgi:hypothetical protein
MGIVLQWQLGEPCVATLVVPNLGDGLMPPPPVRPGQDVVDGVLRRQLQAPEQPTQFGHAQGDQSPRLALNAARLLGPDGGLFLKASTAIAPARSTDSRARAHMAKVIWRYQPVQLRTSY